MKENNQTRLEKQMAEKREKEAKEQYIVRRISTTILTVFAILLLISGILGYRYVSSALKPVSTENKQIEIEIPYGTGKRQIASILEDKHVIRNAKIFSVYMKTKNVGDIQAGFYDLSPSMTLDQIIEVLGQNASSASKNQKKLLVREGDSIDQIADVIEDATHYKKKEFINLMKDSSFMDELVAQFPKLLMDTKNVKDTRYMLEGYLFPATYDVVPGEDLKGIVTKMLQKTDEILTPYYSQVEQSPYNIHEILTLASLIEKEGSTIEDRKHISGVFYNRLNSDMMIQSDISVLYALGEHKEVVTLKDIEVDSPYNLYKHTGLGVGPFNNPSEAAIQAALNPMPTEDYYFVADIKTGKVYYAQSYEEHMELVEKYVNK
ncbi:endolytic transglycosylase MltG [Atopobacter phocae]|uniref:endolytic transglycosylase MltG n=1 Tax=Atopobacter phocae TaxID=136492 RepID=UPI0004716AFF|nr:endolytic transglycosylase MltG [Atopobacter phocae]